MQKMSEEDKGKQLAQLFEQRRGIIEQLKSIRARRSELLKEIDDLSEKLQSETDAHGEVRERVRKLNEERRALATKIRDARSKLRSASDELDVMRPTLRNRGTGLEKELKRVEWRMQTEPLSREQEKELLVRMKEMAQALSVWKKAYGLKNEQAKLGSDIDEMAAKLFDVRADREDAHKELRERRQKIEEYTQAGKQVYGEIQGLDEDIDELEGKVADLDDRIHALRADVQLIQEVERKARWVAHIAASREAIERARKEAMEKMQRGEPISLDDLKLLYGEDGTR